MTAIKKGFTLIELLIVMAILGVLAVVVLIAINPAEQLARARDAGRISGVNQLGRAVTAYFTANTCVPGVVSALASCPSTASWTADLLSSEELVSIPQQIDPALVGVGCVQGWCFAANAAEDYVVYAELESSQRLNQCGAGTTDAYTGFSSRAARGGIWCGAALPVPGSNPDL